MNLENKQYTQYFSKWKKCWVDFKVTPNKQEVKELLKFKYKLR